MVKERGLIFLMVAVLFFCLMVVLSEAAPVPDTGQTKCYDAAGVEIACTGTGQDGAYNINPMSFTDNGNGTVTDNVTGLMWQKEYDNTKRAWAEAGTYCESLTLGGQSGWRLPTKRELITIVDYGIPSPGPTINTTYFPNTYAGYYWSSTTYGDKNSAWYVGFGNGNVYGTDKPGNEYSRCVRGGQSSPSFTNNGNGTATDNGTGLMWQQGEPGSMIWVNALTYCEGLSLGGQTGWRLPNIKELESIIDDTKYNPAIDATYFPNTYANGSYWSSTTNAYGSGSARHVYFGYGDVSSNLKTNDNDYVRCVRGGQSGIQNNCAAILSDSFLLHEPYFTINGSFLSLDLQYAQDAQFPSTDIMFKLSNYKGISTPSDYSNCQASALSVKDNKYVLRIPIIILGGTSYWLDLTYAPTTDGLLWFKLTGFGVN